MKATNKQIIKRLMGIVLVIMMAIVLTGCSTAKDASPTTAPTTAPTAAPAAASVNTYTFEAEYVDLADKAGAGPSNAAMETELVLADSTASNGHFIGYTYFSGLFFDYVFTADAAKEATLKIVLASDMGAIKINPEVFEVSVNGTPLAYDELKVPDGSAKVNKVFKEFTLGKVNLVEGENKITLTILENELYNGGTGGPLIDCIILSTEAVLSWQPVESNVK